MKSAAKRPSPTPNDAGESPTQGQDNSTPRRRRLVGALAILVVLAAALRWPLASEPLWVDELHTSWVVGQGSERLAENARDGNQAPLWFYLPWLTTRGAEVDGRVNATNPWRLRLPSLLAGLAVPLLTYAAARRLTGLAGPAVFAAALAALDPRFAFYATEARAYATLQVVALLHLICWLATRTPSMSMFRHRVWRAAWIATGGLMFYTHYTTALVLVAETLADFGWLAIARVYRAEDQSAAPMSPSRTVQFRRLLLDYCLLLTACLPALPHLNSVASHRADWSRTLSADDPWTMFDWYGMALVPLAVVVATTLQRLWLGHRPRARGVELFPVGRIALMIVVPWLLAWIATACDIAQVLRYRYLIVSATLLPMVPAIALAALPRRAAQGLLVAIVLTVIVARHDMLRPWLETGVWPSQRDERWSALIERLNGLLTEKRVPVLLFPALVEDHRLKVDEREEASESRERLVRFCRFPLDTYASRLPSDTAILPLATLASPRLAAATVEQLQKRGGGLIVVRGDGELAAYLVRQLTAELSRQGLRMTSAAPESHGNLRLIAFTLRPMSGASPSR